jgi:hypothetical protein
MAPPGSFLFYPVLDFQAVYSAKFFFIIRDKYIAELIIPPGSSRGPIAHSRPELWRVFSEIFHDLTRTSQGHNRDITGTSQGPDRDEIPVKSG